MAVQPVTHSILSTDFFFFLECEVDTSILLIPTVRSGSKRKNLRKSPIKKKIRKKTSDANYCSYNE